MISWQNKKSTLTNIFDCYRNLTGPVKKYIKVFLYISTPACLVCLDAIAEPSLSLSIVGNKNSDGAPEPWGLNVWRGEPNFKVVCESDAAMAGRETSACQNSNAVLHLVCDSCSYKLVYQHEFDVNDENYLEWDWKAISLPTGGDVRNESKDDQVLQIYMYFSNGTALNYIWDSNTPVGHVVDRKYVIPAWLRWLLFFIDLPPDVDVRNIVLQSGSYNLGTWIKQRRNIAVDYLKYFGEQVPQGKAVGIQINSQHTNSNSEGMIRRILWNTSNSPD